MIAAFLAPGGPPVIERLGLAIGEAANSKPRAMSVGQTAGVAAYPGNPAGHLDPARRAAWIGSLRGFSLDAPLRSRGDFSLAAMSGPDELLLARGRFGGRPLYYGTSPSDGGLLVCSRLAPLVTALRGSELSPEALAAFLLRGPAPNDPEQTIYAKVRRVPAASVLRIGLDGVRARERLAQPDVVPSSSDRSIDDLADELREHLARAADRAIASGEDVSVCASGGLDSSTLLAMTLRAARKSGKSRVHTFNVAFEASGDDRPYFRALCDALDVVPSQLRPRDFGPGLFESFVADGAPLDWTSTSWYVRMAQLGRERGASAMIMGLGGDDVFAGDLRFLAHRARRGQLTSAIFTAGTLKGWGNTTARQRVRHFVLAPLFADVVGRRVIDAVRTRRSVKAVSWAGRRLRQWIEQGYFLPRSDQTWLEGLSTSSLYTAWAETRAQVEHVGGSTLLDLCLDDDLVEFIASVPPEAMFHGGWVRGLLRHAMRGILPDEVRLRPDKSRFEPAFLELLQAAGGFEAFEPLLTMTALADHGLVEPRAFRLRFAEWVKNPLDGHAWLNLWPVLVAESFVRGASSRPS